MEKDPLYIEVTNANGDQILTVDNASPEDAAAAQELAEQHGGEAAVYQTDDFGNTISIVEVE